MMNIIMIKFRDESWLDACMDIIYDTILTVYIFVQSVHFFVIILQIFCEYIFIFE